MKNEFVVRFIVSYQLDDRRDLLNFMEIEFDEIIEKNLRKKAYGPIPKENFFILENRGKINFDSICIIIEKLKKYKYTLIEARKKRNIEYQLSIVIYAYEANFGFHLDLEDMKILNEIGVSFDCDIYPLNKV